MSSAPTEVGGDLGFVRGVFAAVFPPTGGFKCYPILTISAVVSLSRRLERSYPRRASSLMSVSSLISFTELYVLPKMERILTQTPRRSNSKYHHSRIHRILPN